MSNNINFYKFSQFVNGKSNKLLDVVKVYFNKKSSEPIQVRTFTDGIGCAIEINDELMDSLGFTKTQFQMILLHEVGHYCCLLLKCKIGGVEEELICDFFAMQMAKELGIVVNYSEAAQYLCSALDKFIPWLESFKVDVSDLCKRIEKLPKLAVKAVKYGDPDLKDPKNIIKFVA